MTQKVAVAVVHGIGKQGPDFVEKIQSEIEQRCLDNCGQDIVIKPVHWAQALQDKEDALWERLIGGGPMDYQALRRWLVDFLADALAYQPTTSDRQAYDDIHAEFARTLHRLAEEAGEKAPLCIIAHSLGTVITSNFIYDLQKPCLIPKRAQVEMGDTPLERGETLTLLYTLGSPLALWSLRYREFGQPIRVPAPQLQRHYPHLVGEWVNYYDRDDVAAFPLKTLNSFYASAVTADREVNVGDIVTSWNPLAHLAYWTDRDVVEPISQAIIRTWKQVYP